ncbi:hypothetical protein SAMN06265222_11553 [Neorhodopirellula lusitana]|uniref:Uncharacterized protein n=1 Tax=Neorhodopirellula lusitana TaxID=445327 RepID=A0ABY1QJB3_9BACT|nr:hypothetical protein SAMN06265222_11553 [Neorhodopirellula lusitana]
MHPAVLEKLGRNVAGNWHREAIDVPVPDERMAEFSPRNSISQAVFKIVRTAPGQGKLIFEAKPRCLYWDSPLSSD